ncbi:primase alpha helix C-terminal domain-containing protein [Salinicoccus roseus]|nr:primase alpha helix C-terminal domain-containing protein [Salinicoccus roseus]MCG7331203.1 primase alpha helix C-terminal domain-containing protein [Salinicoccus roseus]
MPEIELDNDTELNFTVFKNEIECKPLKNAVMPFSKLATFLQQPHQGAKNSNYCFVGGTVKTWRNNENTVSRSILTVDIDDIPADTDIFSEISSRFYYGFLIYSTHNHRPEKPRYRLLIPLDKSYELTPDTYRGIIKYICHKVLDIGYYDTQSEVLSQVMYFPTTEHPDLYDFNYQDEEIFTLSDDFMDAVREYTKGSGEGFTVIYDKKAIQGDEWAEILSPKVEGQGRNEALTKIVGSLLRRYVDVELAYHLAQLWNDSMADSLDEKEFNTTFQSIFKKEMARRRRWQNG